MTNGDLVRAATGELYSADPDHFIERRGALAAEARAAGDAAAAKQIGALRKPTRSAWVLNQLVRAEPGATSQLDLLGDELRAAQRALDGAGIRELSVRRRQLIGALARQAFAACGLQSPPAALRDEVTATLGAAMADPEVAEQLRAGTLHRPARRDGFGLDDAPALTLVPSATEKRGSTEKRDNTEKRGKPATRRPPAGPAGPADRPHPAQAAKPPARRPAAPAVKAADLAAAREEAARQRRLQAIAAAELSAAEADQAADRADRTEQEQERAVQLLEEQLADARRDLADARLRARRARTMQRQARQALGRLRD